MKRVISIVFILLFLIYCAEDFPVHKWRLITTDIWRDLYGVWGESMECIWAVGEWGCIYKLNVDDKGNVNYTEPDSPTNSTLHSISFINPNDGFACGDNGTIIKYDGSSWVQVNSSTYSNLYSIYYLSKNLAFAVGDDGTIVKYDGTKWSKIDGITQENLNNVSVINEKLAFACGDHGIVLKYDGENWASIDTGIPISIDLLDVEITNVDSAYICGTGGALFVWNGTDWAQIMTGTTDDITALSFHYPSTGWAVTSNGYILLIEYDTTQLITAPKIVVLNDVHSCGEYDAWAVGNMGIILRYY
ncbi:MAG: YCF48-related protein [bacterium]